MSNAIEALRAALAKPVAWSVTWRGKHCGNVFESDTSADVYLRGMKKHAPEILQESVPLYSLPDAPELLAELDRLKAERDALRAQSSGAAKLAAFGAWCAQEFRRELADVDGGSAQDAMERLGLLKRIEVTEPCGEGCVCAEVGFPADCYVFDDDVKAALKDTTA